MRRFQNIRHVHGKRKHCDGAAARVIGSRRELIEAKETLEPHVAERTEQFQHTTWRAEAADGCCAGRYA